MTRQAKKNTPQTNQLPVSPNPPRGASALPAEVFGPRILLLLSVLALTLIGLVMVYSAGSISAIHDNQGPEYFFVRQLGFAVVGIIFCVAIWKLLPYHKWAGWLVWAAWGAAVLLLILTAAIGTTELGAQRWLAIGPVRLQPSEFAKIALLLMAAHILNNLRNGTLTPKALFVLFAHILILIVIPLVLIYKAQSDLGTTMICFFGILAVMWLGEVRWPVVVVALAAGIAFALWASFTVAYRADRFVFLNPWDDGEGGGGPGYQLIHSFYAFAEGGLFGVGLGNSREKFLYLPEPQTDYIFSIIGEEGGMLAALLVIILFCCILYAGMRIVRKAPDNYGMLLAGGCTLMIVFQAFLNIAGVIGLFANTGKPLPFISSGGSSLIATFCMLGIILSVSQAEGAPDVYAQRRADLRVIRAEQGPPRHPGRGASSKAARTSFVDGRGAAVRAVSAGGTGPGARPGPAAQGRKAPLRTDARFRQSGKGA